jgi:toxin ParE1/3/4
MAYSVILLPEAERELNAIADFIALDNPVRAISFAIELLEKAYTLANSPFTYAPLTSHPQFRKKSYKGYIILYTIEADTVYIAHIFNSVRDYTKLLK